MLRAAGMALVVLACTALGVSMGRELLERVRALRELERLLTMLKSEIQYAATPLREAFSQLAARGQGRYCGFFTELASAMEERNGKSIAQLFRECADTLLTKTGLSRADIEQLVNLGARLGCLDRDMQLRTIALYQEELAGDRAAAEEDYREKAKVYRALGFLGGIFLVILFL